MSGVGVGLLYHRVARMDNSVFELAVSPENFREQMEVVTRHRPLAVGDAARALRSGALPDSTVLVTFDDGYLDNLRSAVPVLEQLGVPATVFVATGATGTRRAFWWDELADLVQCAPDDARPAPLALGGETLRFGLDEPDGRVGAIHRLWFALRRSSAVEIEGALAVLREWAGRSNPLEYDDGTRVMDRDELRTLHASPAMSVGAHTVTHPLLGARTPEDQLAELVDSRRALEDWIDAPVTSFAYPFGRPHVDYTRVTVRAARAAGFTAACAVRDRELTAAAGPLEIPRWAPPDVDGATFERLLAQRLRRPAAPARLRRAIDTWRIDRRER